MFSCDPRLAILDDYHRSADPPSVTSNVDCLLVMVYVDPYEFVDLSCSPQCSEIVHETRGIAGDADDRTVYVNDKGSGGIDFCACCKRNIWRPNDQ